MRDLRGFQGEICPFCSGFRPEPATKTPVKGLRCYLRRTLARPRFRHDLCPGPPLSAKGGNPRCVHNYRPRIRVLSIGPYLCSTLPSDPTSR